MFQNLIFIAITSIIDISDFNMSKEFEIKDGSIVVKANLVNQRNIQIQTPRNDLIGLAYTLVTLFTGDIPQFFIDDMWLSGDGRMFSNEELDVLHFGSVFFILILFISNYFSEIFC